ncbi:MAG: hypothetical protein IJ746_00815 [Ruminococcus sp.]|nr:hypothetical protein [Ruminococcus sp.]
MDVFKEQNVIRQTSKNDNTRKILIVFIAVMLAMALFLFSMMIPQLLMFGIALAALSLYGGYYFVTAQYIEYEYILTNGELDVDKIIAQRSRKRLCTVQLSKATALGEVSDSSDAETDGADTYVVASANDPEEQDYYLRVKHKSLGDTVIIFTPNEEMLDLIKKSLPRTMRV